MSTLSPGFRVGHWTSPGAKTGCTVVLPPPGAVTSCDVRGSSPSSRELEHLHPDRKMTEIHGIVLTGGSAFGLASAHGAMIWLEEQGTGYRTPGGIVPIVPAAVIFDRAAFDPGERPGPEAGYAACASASADAPTGRVGAGAGATVGKWAGFDHHVPGGIGAGAARHDGVEVRAIAVVNAVGDVIDEDGSVIAGTKAPDPSYVPMRPRGGEIPTNTVLAVLTTTAHLDKRDVRYLAARGSDGITLSVRPAHTRYDGDVVFACAVPDGTGASSDLDLLGRLATLAVADAVRNAVR